VSCAARIAAVVFAFGLLGGCTDLAEFSGDYRGGVVGADDEDCPAGRTCSFIRRGFPEGTQLRLADFRPRTTSGSPGTLTTDPDGAPGDRYDAFTDTALRVITPLTHDQLSLYDFPGGGRIRNDIFAATPATGPLAGRDVMIFLSLMEDDDIELRIIAGPGNDAAGDHFGLFVLERE
jgi:hypothetical protein